VTGTEKETQGMSREIEVWADWQELDAPILMGHLP
jgi:hypothetical protein